jgi:hypothetical protein
MATTNATVTHNVIAASGGGGSTALKSAFDALASGGSGELVLTDTQWPSGAMQDYQFWTSNAYWDATVHKLYLLTKLPSNGPGALHIYDAATHLWSQPWAGWWSSSDGGTTQGLAHPFTSWTISPVDQKIFISDWYARLRRYDTQTTEAWTDLYSLTSPAPFNTTGNVGLPAWGLTTLQNAFASSTEGFLLSTPVKLFMFKRDGTSNTAIWTKASNQTVRYQFVQPWYDSIGNAAFMCTGQGYTKTGSAYNNASSRATAEVAMYRIQALGNGTATVTRLQDAPSANVGSANSNHDKICAYGNNLYLFEADGTGVWKYDLFSDSWTKLATPHNFRTIAGSGWNITPVYEYGGIVCVSGASSASQTSGRPHMYLYKV